MADLHTAEWKTGWVWWQEMIKNKTEKKGIWERYHMAVWATSNGETALKVEVPFDISYKVEWRSDLDFVRCVREIYNHGLDVSCRECHGYLLTVTDWQGGKWFLRSQQNRITTRAKKTVKRYKAHKSLIRTQHIRFLGAPARFLVILLWSDGKNASRKQCQGRQAQMLTLPVRYKK